jgi:hypothetical protein
MGDGSNLRASDEDRERAVQEIKQHFAAGRLTEDELDGRVRAAYAAQTEVELARVRQDLPRLPLTPAEHKAQLAERRGELQRRLLQEGGGAAIVFGVCSLIWVGSGASGQFWPIWVAIVCLLPLLRTGWLLYGPAPDFERAEQQLASYRAWNRRHDPLLRREQRRAQQDAARDRRDARRDARRRH